jgi:predicted Fe-Mo cluster-binding NifX family protein
MKVVVTAEAVAWDARVDPRFGRAPVFVLLDTDTRELSGIDNSRGVSAGQGAGVQAAAAVCRAGATTVLTGHCGPKAFAALIAGGVRVFTGAEGTVAEAVERFEAGTLVESRAADIGGHWG